MSQRQCDVQMMQYVIAEQKPRREGLPDPFWAADQPFEGADEFIRGLP